MPDKSEKGLLPRDVKIFPGGQPFGRQSTFANAVSLSDTVYCFMPVKRPPKQRDNWASGRCDGGSRWLSGHRLAAAWCCVTADYVRAKAAVCRVQEGSVPPTPREDSETLIRLLFVVYHVMNLINH